MPDSIEYETLKAAVRPVIARASPPSPDFIRTTIGQFRAIPSLTVSDDDAERLAREIESQLDIRMTLGASVHDEGFVEWYPTAKAGIEPYYWDRYSQLLEEQDFPPDVIAGLDVVTDRITGYLNNPRAEAAWDRRGMVVGHVQSGKTANYTGLICKAADAGYKLIVVIAGIHNNLRNQTQRRIDEGFVGRDSGKPNKPFIGVSRFAAAAARTPITLTNATMDFRSTIAEAAGMEIGALNVPLVLVIKKNTKTLQNLIAWLRAHNMGWAQSLVDAPMLLIDDEADNASVNTSADPNKATRINALIREMLNLFSKKCYVGYTATPFANIFIDPDSVDDMLQSDLYPRDFIVTLDAPDNYFGASRIFGGDIGDEVLRDITDNADDLPLVHKITQVIPALPESLKQAVRSFILARAIRIIRGHGHKHSSMLVNASRFTNVQKQLRNLIHDYVGRLSRAGRHEGAKPELEALRNEHIGALRQTWEREYSHLGYEWRDIQDQLLSASAPIQVVEVNSASSGSLAYEAHEELGLQVIAVGGFSLSRGLTLEGLTISYFLRNSMMYDTLLQMGRWFGYRPGYEDLCRIWMPPEARGWYEHISESIEELRDELMRMQRANLTPRDFGLRVRAHPDTLIVTARNKMRSAQAVPVVIGLSGRFIETYALYSDTLRSGLNRAAAIQLVEHVSSSLGHDGTAGEWADRHRVWSGVDHTIIETFIRSFNNNDRSIATQSEPVAAFIEKVALDGHDLWDVAVVGLADASAKLDDDLGVRCQRRTGYLEEGKKDLVVVGTKNRVSSRGVEKIGISKVEREKVEAGRRAENLPDKDYRLVRSRPLLVIQPVILTKAKSTAPITEKPLISWGISFPHAEGSPPTVTYAVTGLWWRQYIGDDEGDEEIDADED